MADDQRLVGNLISSCRASNPASASCRRYRHRFVRVILLRACNRAKSPRLVILHLAYRINFNLDPSARSETNLTCPPHSQGVTNMANCERIPSHDPRLQVKAQIRRYSFINYRAISMFQKQVPVKLIGLQARLRRAMDDLVDRS
jgi:hypothetical protein